MRDMTLRVSMAITSIVVVTVATFGTTSVQEPRGGEGWWCQLFPNLCK